MKRCPKKVWQKFLKDNDMTFQKFSRLIFPEGVPLSRKIARPKERVLIEDEANIEL